MADHALLRLRDALAFQRDLGGPLVPDPFRPAPAVPAVPAPSADGPPPPAAPLDLLPPEADPAPSSDPERPEASDPMATIDLFGGATPEPPADADPYARVDALVPDDHPVKAATTLAELEAIVREHRFIPLDAHRILPVFGVGDPHAGLMVIGEAPGADEDRTGEPFVGRAGQLLTKILEAIGFKRADVYITNILKSRPPGNRDPEPDEIGGHLPILLRQIALVRPKVILCVGKTAGNALLGRRSALGGLRDREHSFHGLPLFVTYHPAALLRNEQWKRPTWEDVKLMRARYDALVGGA